MNIFRPTFDKLDNNPSTPLYIQLRDKIVQQIRNTHPAPGTRVLSEREIATTLNLDRSTVHRAYIQLLEEGIFEKRPPSRSLFIAPDTRQKLKPSFPSIGIVLPTCFSKFINEQEQYRLRYFKGIVDRAAELEYSTIIVNLPSADSDANYVMSWKENVIDRLIGIIHMGDRAIKNDMPLQTILEDSSISQVFISGYSTYPHIGSVTGDIEPGTVAAAEHLRENGHTKVGLISRTPLNPKIPGLYKYDYLHRTQNIRKCFTECGLEIQDNWILEHCTDIKRLKEYLVELLKSQHSPRAFWCSNDRLAFSTIDVIEQIGFKVPDDISVIGFDDLPLPNSHIQQTSIRMPFYYIGSRAVDALHDYYEQGINETNRAVTLPTSLAIKESVGNINPHPYI